MNTIPKISVIMPSLNVAPYIEECMESVLEQSLQDIEILSIDAGSTDGTYEALQKYAARDARIRLIQSSVKSYGAQVNQGITLATGKYVAVVETDDFIARDMFEELYNLAEENQLDFVKGDYENVQRNEKGAYEFQYVPMFYGTNDKANYGLVIDPQDFPRLHCLGLNIWRGIYRREFLQRCNVRCNETKGAAFQDTGFHHRALLTAKRVMYVEKAYYKYRQDREESSFRYRNTLRYDYDEYRLLLGDRSLEPFMRKEDRRYIYVKMAGEFLVHFEKLVKNEDSALERPDDLSNEISWFCGQMQEGFARQWLKMEDFPEETWFALMLLSESPDAYRSYLKIKWKMQLQKELKLCEPFSEKPVVIFGCGAYGIKAFQILQKNKVQVAAWCDNDSEKWGTEQLKLKVYAPEQCVKLLPEAYYLVASRNYGPEMKEQLERLGVDPGKIVFYA